MVGKLNRLPAETQKALQQFACMGNSAEFEMLRMVYPGSVEGMHDDLWEAVRSGLIFRGDDSYRFLHDRVQEAAYSLIPKDLRAEAHLRIGMLLAAHTPPAKREEAIFEIVNQLNRGSHLIASVEERERVADLNLIAGKRAKSATAYDAALKYLRAGSALLTEETWQRNYELVFSIEHLMAECEMLTAEMVVSGRSHAATLAACEEPPRRLCHDALAAHAVHQLGQKRPRTRRVPGVAPPRRHRLVETSDPRRCDARVRTDLDAARQSAN